MSWDRTLVKNTKYKTTPGEFNGLEFAAALQAQYEKGIRTSDKKKKSFSPSGVGYGNGTCPRYWFHAFTGCEFEDGFDALGIANMENGKFVHDRLQGMISEMDGYQKIELEKEVLCEDPPIRGFADVILESHGELIVGEIKSMKDEQFTPRVFKMVPPGYHLLQLVIYLKVLGSKEGFFLYENKNTQQILVIPITMNARNEALAEYALDWMRKVYKNWEDDVLPTRSFTKSSLACKGCPVRKTCWAGEKGDVTIPIMEVPKQ